MSAARTIALPADDAPNVEWALACARVGLRVHPLYWPTKTAAVLADARCACGRHDCGRSTGKHPILKGWQSLATTDEDQIREWWARYPLANPGIAAGEGSGICTLDADGTVGRASLAALNLPPTFTVETGAGEHRYFQHPEVAGLVVANTVSRIAPNVDVRTERGNVAGPGSLHWSGRRYRIANATPPVAMPEHAIYRFQELAEQDDDPKTEARPKLRLVHDETIPEATREEWARAYARKIDVAISGSGGHTATFIAAEKIARGFDLPEDVALRVLADEFNERCQPPWSMRDLHRKVQEAVAKGRFEWGALVRERAERQAQRDSAPRSRVSETRHDEPPPPIAEDTPDILRSVPYLARVAIVGADRIRELAARPVAYLWRDIAIAGIIVLLAGGPGEGKTTLLFLILIARLNMGAAVTLLGRTVEPAPAGKWIVLIEGEHAEGSASRKLVRSCALLGIDDQCLDRIILVARKAVRLGSPEWQDVGKLVAAGLVSDIAIDTVARVAPGDANNEQEQVAIFDAVAQTIEMAPGDEKPVVWAVAHTRKNGQTGDLSDVGGSTQRTGQTDTVLMVKGTRVDGRTVASKVTFAKLREEPDEYPPPTTFSIAKGRVTTSESREDDDRPLETRILEILHFGPQTKTALGKALGRSDKDVDAALTNLFSARRVRTTQTNVRGQVRKAFVLRSDGPSSDTRRIPDVDPSE